MLESPLLQVHQLVGHKLFQALQVLSIKLHVVVASTLHPQGLDGPLTALIQGQAVRKINHLVLCTMDYQDWRRHLGDFVNAGKWVRGLEEKTERFKVEWG